METFDLRQVIIPFALLRITNYFYRMPVGETIEIVSDDASISEDLKRILPASMCEMMCIIGPPHCGPDLHILLKKTLSHQ